MYTETIFDTCEQQGWRIDRDKGTGDGVINGVAFRVTLSPCSILLSVRLAEKQVPRLETQLSAIDPAVGAVTVSLQERGILVSLSVTPLSGESLITFVTACIDRTVKAADASFDDKHVSGTADPLSAYLLGILGAFLGAAVGVLPWFLTGYFLGWQLWLLGGLVGVAAFFGYRLFRGAHSTRFAVWTLVICSLLAVAGGQFVSTVHSYWSLAQEFKSSPEYYAAYYEAYGNQYEALAEDDLTVGEVIAFCFRSDIVLGAFSDSLYGMLICGLGVLLLKGRIQDYTHNAGYLRSRRFR